MVDSSLTALEAAQILGVQITKGKDVVQRRVVSEGDETAWSTAAELLLTQIFGKDSPVLKGFEQARPRPGLSDFKNADAMAQHRKQTVLNRIQVLASLMDLLQKNAERDRQKERASMAKGRQAVASGPTLAPAVAGGRLRDQIEKGSALLRGPISSEAQQAWLSVTKQLLIQAFGSASHCVNDVMNYNQFAGMALKAPEEFEKLRAVDMKGRLAIMEGLADMLERETKPESPSKLAADNSRVFLVHGHEQGIVHECARLVDRFGLTAVILHEQPNEGRTIIEKFEHHADAGFAIVFLTPDDVGSEKDGNLRPRARQNVILELGYFTGKLGRKRTCALHRDGVELPSDYHGVLYVSLDKDDWKMKVAQEMKAAGLNVDLNKVVE